MSTTDAALIGLGERFEKRLLEYMDAWLAWAPLMRAARAEAESDLAGFSVAIHRNGCDAAQARMSELEDDAYPTEQLLRMNANFVAAVDGAFASGEESRSVQRRVLPGSRGAHRRTSNHSNRPSPRSRPPRSGSVYRPAEAGCLPGRSAEVPPEPRRRAHWLAPQCRP